MKIFKYIMIFMVSGTAILSCKQDNYMLYDAVSYLQFGPSKEVVYTGSYLSARLRDTLKTATFFYESEKVVSDTIYFDLYTIGGAKKQDRKITFEQVQVKGVENAVPGVHYKAFDSPEMAKIYVMSKDSVHLSVPIVILRDKSLKDKEVVLQFRILKNEEFELGETDLLWRRLSFTDALQRPAAWTASASDYTWGEYSKTKHLWMIEITGEKWDQEFMGVTLGADYALQNFWQEFLLAELIKKNNELEAAGEDKFKDENGHYIQIPL